jgi:short-chain fatty acids transporter
VLAVGLSILAALLAALFAPKGSVTTIFTGWYNGLFSILAFAFQVLLILVTGFALSTSAHVRAVLRRLASLGTTPNRAIVLTIVTVYFASFLNWGFGLVVAGLIAREIAQRIRIDFGWCIWRQSGFSLDLNSVIFLFLIAGLLLHWRPIAYIQAVNRAARVILFGAALLILV